METSNDKLANAIENQQIEIQAAQIATAPLVSTGWKLVLGGWAAGFVPLLGALGWAVAFFGGIVIGIILMSRKNTSDGVKLLLAGWFGTAIVGLIQLLFIWSIVGFGLAALA